MYLTFPTFGRFDVLKMHESAPLGGRPDPLHAGTGVQLVRVAPIDPVAPEDEALRHVEQRVEGHGREATSVVDRQEIREPNAA